MTVDRKQRKGIQEVEKEYRKQLGQDLVPQGNIPVILPKASWPHPLQHKLGAKRTLLDISGANRNT